MALPAFGTIKSDATDWGAWETGMPGFWAGLYNAIPAGFLICDGAAISRSTYSDLFDIIGTRYGVGNGSTTFNVPDMRDKFPRGAPNVTSGGGTGGACSHYHCIKGRTCCCVCSDSGFYRGGMYSVFPCGGHYHCLKLCTCTCEELPPHVEFVFIIKT
ncbi:hypothetical protein LCGC14_2808220 [marine sediment metagenome]|uniref:Phage tail collar domain-containing protein n=1 Tax=marine sediment metagenome TaxID=412755 RepID=A0A0F8Z7I6_9ZZZZ